MQVLSLEAWALLLTLCGLVGDFGSAWFQLWALVFAFAFSYWCVVGRGFGGLVAFAEGLLVVEGEAEDVFFDPFEVGEDWGDFGLFGLFVHDF